MSEIKPCPCGQTPTVLVFEEGQSSKWGLVRGSCCHEWMIEFRTGYNQRLPQHLPELQRLMLEAWNAAARASEELGR